jgi:hypothetical protein
MELLSALVIIMKYKMNNEYGAVGGLTIGRD